MATCPFCAVVEGGDLRWANDHAVAFADRYPISAGHTLVVPRAHQADLFDLRADERAALWALVDVVRTELVAEHRLDGFNIGVNIGEAAGQTVAHAHVHVIPRYRGDVPDPRGGIRWVLPDKAAYWT